MKDLILTRLIARQFIVGFEGTQIDAELAELVRLGVGGVIFFKRNLPSCEQAMELNRELLELAKENPLLFCLDQEGGRVQRLGPPLLQLPSMRQLGQANDPDLCRCAGAQLGLELSALGYHLDLAPVFDVDSNPQNPVIGDRAFGDDAERVARLGVAFALGLQQSGVCACAKHFPGHGDTSQDSHLTLPHLDVGMDRLRSLELRPFADAFRSGVDALLMAHLKIPALDPDQPASLSKAAYRLAREELGFSGPILTDDLEMKAVSHQPGVVQAAVAAIAAGADGALICRQTHLALMAIEACVLAVERGELDRALLEASNQRWNTWAARFGVCGRKPDPAQFRSFIQSPDRADLARRLRAIEGSS